MKINKSFFSDDSKIAEFYSNKTIFLTGGTGFLGKGECSLIECKPSNLIQLQSFR